MAHKLYRFKIAALCRKEKILCDIVGTFVIVITRSKGTVFRAKLTFDSPSLVDSLEIVKKKRAADS